MNKLRRKILFVLISILSLFLISILIIFNSQNYYKEKENVREVLLSTNKESRKLFGEDEHKNFDNEGPKQPRMFMNVVVYTVLLDNDNNIKSIINRNEEGENTNLIEKIANEILKSDDVDEIYVGNLYFDRYSYSYLENNYLTIIDNNKLNNSLRSLLVNSIIIFFTLEIIIIVVAIKITNWISIPVLDSFKKQKQFIEDASHELKTPIAVILASSEALESEPNERKWLNNIQNEALRMNKLVVNLLDLARLENVDLKKTFVLNDLSKIIEKSVLTFESLIYEKNIKLDYAIEDNIKFNCNQDQISELLSILIDNAIKHSSDKGNIKISLINDNNNLVLEVINKGKAIPKEKEERIFERFYREDTSRNRNENRYGLGLAIAKNIVEIHGGSIKAFSKDGYTTFRIIFKNIKKN